MANATTLQPTLQDDAATTKILAKIKQLEANLNAKNRQAASQGKDQLLLELNQEHDRLARKRQDQCNSLLEDWQSYQQDQKKTRQADVAKRQIEFDRQLDVLDEEKRRNWVSHTQDTSEICDQLLHYLKHCSIDSTILTFPPNVLDQFWALQIQIPVLEAELPATIDTLTQLASKHRVGS
ncbi:hypothetical protein FB192DRAFT_1374041 [Mucor lusitanicus]|uniref:Uncharacterized protein n=1 Tax=Mucor circinelloides f. lusitanicus TaxID=29924 RepID=A0A8H4BHX6_MUCCL|nr:hypothetical protein FB192DRAFT_1374041 [Mucor lusitanicus]